MSRLPGADICANEWHLLKCVATKQCPDCGMSIDVFNREMKMENDAWATMDESEVDFGDVDAVRSVPWYVRLWRYIKSKFGR